MTIEEIKHGETDTLEFKREFPSKDTKLMKTVAAFSNCHGGRIVFGVDDETKVEYSADDFSFTATVKRQRKDLFANEEMSLNVSKNEEQFPNNDRINDRLTCVDRINDRLNLSETEKQIFSEIEKNPFVKTERRTCFFDRVFYAYDKQSCKILARKKVY